METKILLVNPPSPDARKFTRNCDCASESKGNYLWQPYDFLLLSGAFTDSTEIVFVDGVAQQLSKQETLEKSKINPQLIITAVIDSLWDWDLQFLKDLRKLHPETPILCLGDALLEEHNLKAVLEIADGALQSPLTFQSDKITSWSRDFFKTHAHALGLMTTKPEINKRSVLGRSLMPRHELFQHPRYRWPFNIYKRYTTITTSWGCPYSCSYCTAVNLPSIYRSAEEILLEMERIRELGIKELYFSDKSFGLPFENTKKILDGMVARNFKFVWSSYFHPNQYTPEFLELMKVSGCHTLIIGIESKNFEKLRGYGRVFSEKKLQNLLEHANQLKINICGDFIIGLPGETEADIKETINFATGLPLDFASFNIATPLPSTLFRRQAVTAGKMKYDDHHFDTTGMSHILDSDSVSAESLVQLRNEAVRRFYVQPRYWIRRLSRIRGPEHFHIQIQEAFALIKNTLFFRRSS